jgi:hypothetical protein
MLLGGGMVRGAGLVSACIIVQKEILTRREPTLSKSHPYV